MSRLLTPFPVRHLNITQCITILQNIANVAPIGAKLLNYDFLILHHSQPDNGARDFDVHMMVASTGRERSREEMAGLFEKGGWELVDVKCGPVGPLALFEGVKKA